nr:mitogen-activated protein kinase kinase 5-like [Ipomoea batatas]
MSSSSIGSTQWLREVRCWCGEVAPVKMSWSDANPGKRYRACPHYGGNGNCWYFEWIDSDVTERVSRVIRGLLKKLDKKDNEIERLQTAIEKQNGERLRGNLRAVNKAISEWESRSPVMLMPDTTSPELRNFIGGCLEIDPENRLTVRDLLGHPFISRCPLI